MIKADRRIRVLFVSHAPRLEGAEKSLLDLVEVLHNNYMVEPIVIVPRPGKLEKELINKKIPYFRANRIPWWVDSTKGKRILFGPLKWMWNYLLWYLLRDKIKCFNPDLVYINTLVCPFGAIVAKQLGIPMIWHAREFIPEWLGRDYDFGRKWALSIVAKSAAVIGNSEAVAEHISDCVPEQRLHVIYNGIRLPKFNEDKFSSKLDYFYCSKGRPIRLLMVGSINKNKDQATAVRALSCLKKRGIYSDITLVGEIKGNYGAELKKLITELGVDNQVFWKGWQKDVRAFYEAADITLVCSKGEPFGRTIIESMAFGTPVICSNSGGAPEIVKMLDEKLLFRSEDDKDLADKIEQLIKDKSWYQNLALKGRIIVEKFDIDVQVGKVYELIEGINPV